MLLCLLYAVRCLLLSSHQILLQVEVTSLPRGLHPRCVAFHPIKPLLAVVRCAAGSAAAAAAAAAPCLHQIALCCYISQ
jgi:hypothetical protein